MADEEVGLPVGTIQDELFPGIITDNAPTPSVVESETVTNAKASGWKTKEEWIADGGQADEHVSAHEFIRAGEMIGRIKSQNNQLASFRKAHDAQINSLEATLKELVEHNRMMAESQLESARRDILADRAQATIDQDAGAIVQYDEQLEKLREVSAPTAQAQPVVDPDQGTFVATPEQTIMQDWQARPENDWMKTDTGLRGAFLSYADEILDNDPTTNFLGALEAAKKIIVKENPSKFKGVTPPVTGGAPIDGAPSGTGTSKRFGPGDLSPEQLSVADNFVKFDVFKSRQEYVDQLASMGELG